MSHVIAIDIGSSGIKIGALDRSGNLIFTLRQHYKLTYPRHGWVEIEVNEVWELTKMLLREMSNKILEIQGTIDAVGLSTFCNASVFMDERGESLCPGIMYLDHRSEYEAEWIKNNVGLKNQYQVTRNRIEPGMFSITTLLWTKQNCPDVWNRVFKWGHLSTFILRKLTNEFVIDWTQASFSGVFDVVNYSWSHELLTTMGIDCDILPTVVDPCQIIGFVTSEELPEYAGVQVVAGGADTACSALAIGIQPNEMFESVGTSDVLTVCTENPDRFDDRFLNRCHIFKNQWLSHGAMSTPGASINWFRENFLQTTDFNDMESLTTQSDLGANGLFFLPYMFGERTPVWDKDATGAFVGLSLTTSKADMLRAMFEGCSYGLGEIYEIIREKYAVSVDVVPQVGGGSNNPTWAQIKANVLGLPIAVLEVTETALLGAGLLAASSVGYFALSQSDFAKLYRKPVKTYYPHPQDVLFYEQQMSVYKRIYPALKSIFINRTQTHGRITNHV